MDMDNEKAALNNEKAALNNEKAALNNEKAVLEKMANWAADPMGDCEVFSSRSLGTALGIPRGAVLKALHGLRDRGLVERASQGRPAVEYYCDGGYELDHEAMPPVNGWRLTHAGYNTPEYKAAKEKATEAMRRWGEMEESE